MFILDHLQMDIKSEIYEDSEIQKSALGTV